MSQQQSLERIEAGQPASILEVIERASLNPAVDVEKMRALLEMHEHVLARDAHVAFNQAMAQAQGEVQRIKANALNPQTRSKYATYDALDKVLRPIYIRHGFALSFGTADSSLSEHVRIVADVSHKEGHSKRYQIDMPADGKGARGGDVMTKTHAVGAGVSYGMRYLLKMIFNVAIGEDDNDGNDVQPTIDKDQIVTLEALIEEVDADRAKFLQHMKIQELADLPVSRYKDAVTALEKKRGQSK